MKYLLIFLFVFSTVCLEVDSLQAQPKVLICTKDSNNDLEKIVTKYYSGPVDIQHIIDSNILKYDVLFLAWDIWQFSKEQIPIRDSLLLVFLNGDKKFYWETNTFFDTTRATRPLMTKLGIKEAFVAELFDFSQYYRGVKGTFTDGIIFERPEGWQANPISWDLLHILGDAKEVLVSDLQAFDYYYEVDSLKIVFGERVNEIYEEFLTRVMCDYFGLCTPLEVNNPVKNTEGIKIARNGDQIIIESYLNKPQQIELALYDPLGRLVKVITEGWQNAGEFKQTINRSLELPASSWNVLVLRKKGEGEIYSKIVRF